jgi:phage FluMu protein gp41
MLPYENSFLFLAREIRLAGFPEHADRILKLSGRDEQVVSVLTEVFQDELGETLARERASNLAAAILYHEPEDPPLVEDLQQGLLLVNKPHHAGDYEGPLSDRRAKDLATKAIQKLRSKHLLPPGVH